ncbi:very low-density lipoprotein receptor-like [Tropilaelaps mercedesae]|uniref:Very low-density lipoprotein receptor-like n=1 Tax=Tropilaelaps mercedesae TaxID=418985 RepID=A0A1V9Y3I0_9ACAR|nr:very low-density lipoprotein receptor-like [Tropilaelaps mercedesae]
MRGCFWLALLIAVAEANSTVGQSSAKRDLPYFCLGRKEHFFVCASKMQCFNKRTVCDGYVDCLDGSDEASCACTRHKDCPRGQKCRKNLDLAQSECSPCGDGRKFNVELGQCEDVDECRSSDDVCAGQGQCVNYDGGFACVDCPKGYEGYMHDWRDFVTANCTADDDPAQSQRRDSLRRLFLCTDEDECANENPCRTGDIFSRGESQYCVNTVGNFSCECPPNHKPRESGLDDDPGAVVDNVCRAVGSVPFIAIAENSSINLYDLRSSKLITRIGMDEPPVDIAAYKQTIFYAFSRQIWEFRVATESNTLILDLEEDADFASKIKKLAVDWVNRRIYYLTSDAVAVANFFGESGKIIEHRGNISTIAVDPVARYLFYSEQGSVKRTHLDGRPIGSATIFQALDTAADGKDYGSETLALDPNLASLYYVYDRVLYSFDYSGHHAIVLHTLAPFAYLEPFEDRLYAAYRSDATGVVSFPRIGYTIGPREGRASVVIFYESRPRAMAVLHGAKHPEGPKSGACSLDGAESPCGLSGWCFPLPAHHSPNYRCVCGQADGSATSVRRDCVTLNVRLLRPKNSFREEEDLSGGNNVISAEISGAASSRHLIAVLRVSGHYASLAIPTFLIAMILARLM